jgi:hypothetical protein
MKANLHQVSDTSKQQDNKVAIINRANLSSSEALAEIVTANRRIFQKCTINPNCEYASDRKRKAGEKSHTCPMPMDKWMQLQKRR